MALFVDDEIRLRAQAEDLLRAIANVAGPHRRIVVTGGWSHDDAVRASKSSLGAVEAPRVVEAGARGAALMGGVAAGIYAGVDELPALGAAPSSGTLG